MDIIKDCEAGFAFRTPPSGVNARFEYNMCFSPESCRFGIDRCSHAHSVDEMTEWTERRRLCRWGDKTRATSPPTKTKDHGVPFKVRLLNRRDFLNSFSSISCSQSGVSQASRCQTKICWPKTSPLQFRNWPTTSKNRKRSIVW